MSTFIPAGGATTNIAIATPAFYPDLSTDEMREATGLGTLYTPQRLAMMVKLSAIAVNQALTDWQADQELAGHASLDAVPADQIGDESILVQLYRAAVYCRARAQLLNVTRDYDATRDGHDRADELEQTAFDWMAQSHEALARIMGRSRSAVELI